MLVLRSNLGDSAACKITGLTLGGGALNAVAFRGMVVGSLQYVPISRRRVCVTSHGICAPRLLSDAPPTPGIAIPGYLSMHTYGVRPRKTHSPQPPLSPYATHHSAANVVSGGTPNVNH